MSVICPRCESENPSSLQYCDFCGYELRSEIKTVVEDTQVQNKAVLSGKPQPITEPGSFSEAELWVELGSFLNQNLEDYSFEDVQNIEETKRVLTGMTELDLSDAGLNELPECIVLLTHLQLLELTGNNLKTVPDVLRALTNLKSLELWDNKLKELPVWLTELKEVTEVNVSNNNFRIFPEIICHMTWLKTLDLSANKLTDISNGIGNLVHLEGLDLSENELTSLPDTLPKLKAVHQLDVSWNKLNSLPNGFDTMTNIVSLDLDRNNLTSLPEELEDWDQMTYFSIKNNPISPNDLSSHLSKLNGTDRRGMSTFVWLVFLAFCLIPVLFTLFAF